MIQDSFWLKCISKCISTPCPEKNGTNNVLGITLTDKYKCRVVILALNVVKVMQNQTNTTKVHHT